MRGKGRGKDERTNIQKLLDHYVELEIGIIGVTDHGDAASIAIFREEANTRRIRVFPYPLHRPLLAPDSAAGDVTARRPIKSALHPCSVRKVLAVALGRVVGAILGRAFRRAQGE